MLSETIERVNRLRQQALADPAFIQSAKAHEKAIHSQDNQHASKSKSAKPRKDRTPAPAQPADRALAGSASSPLEWLRA